MSTIQIRLMIGFTLRITVSASENSKCHSQINLLMRAAISYSGGLFFLESYKVLNFVSQYIEVHNTIEHSPSLPFITPLPFLSPLPFPAIHHSPSPPFTTPLPLHSPLLFPSSLHFHSFHHYPSLPFTTPLPFHSPLLFPFHHSSSLHPSPSLVPRSSRSMAGIN